MAVQQHHRRPLAAVSHAERHVADIDVLQLEAIEHEWGLPVRSSANRGASGGDAHLVPPRREGRDVPGRVRQQPLRLSAGPLPWPFHTDPSGLLSRSEQATVDDQSLAAYVARRWRSEEDDRRCNIGGSSLHSKRYPRFECCMAFVGVPYTRPVRLIERCVYPAGCHAVNAYPSTRKPER